MIGITLGKRLVAQLKSHGSKVFFEIPNACDASLGGHQRSGLGISYGSAEAMSTRHRTTQAANLAGATFAISAQSVNGKLCS